LFDACSSIVPGEAISEGPILGCRTALLICGALRGITESGPLSVGHTIKWCSLILLCFPLLQLLV
jgi:hypothetical protein